MIRATKGKSMDGWMDGWMDGEDLIICVARLVVQKLRVPLTCDDSRVRCIASRKRLRLASLCKRILEVLGAILGGFGSQNDHQHRFFGSFFAMFFSNAFWHRFSVVF